MRRFFSGAAFKLLCIILAALLAGSVFALCSRSGSSPFTRVTSFVFSPAARLASAVSRGFADLPVSFKSSTLLNERIKELEKEVETLNEKIGDYEKVMQENAFYEQFLGLKKENPDFQFVHCSVIGTDGVNNYSVLTLNHGASQGISMNDPVVYGEYLVGVVTAVTEFQCTVKTILNPDVSVSAYDLRSREAGFVTTDTEYSEKGLCCVPGLASDTAVSPGTVICTAGVGGIYPRDLIIGTVSDIIDGTAEISATAIVTPGAPLSSLTDIMVITDFR